jgi:hypothetical protein
MIKSAEARRSAVTGHGRTAPAHENEDHAARVAGPEPAPSWDFSKLPVFSSGHAERLQRPPLCTAPRLRGPIQTKLIVGAVNDPLEHEADRVADQVMRMPAPEPSVAAAPPQVSRKCAECEEEEEKLRRKSAGSQGVGNEATALVHEVLRSPGQPLDTTTRGFFEPRFRQDFSRVRVHTGATAEQSARDVNAHAYTVGPNMVFAAGRFAPATHEGRRLIAHELTHVTQQENGSSAGAVQRAEADDRSCSGLKDIEKDIDDKVNQELADERTAIGTPIFAPLFLLHVVQRLGGRSAVSPIEEFVTSLPASKRKLPPDDLASTKYSGADRAKWTYSLQGKSFNGGVIHVVGPVAKIHGICVGADKLGHFFDQGFDFFEAATKAGATAADVDNLGREMETGAFGLAATGVFSNADIEANRAGADFYRKLEKNPAKFNFRIRDHITAKWSEVTNPNFYESGVGKVVWSNLLTGPWQGTFTPARDPKPIKTSFNLIATDSGNVTGTFELKAKTSPTLPKDVTIKNGTIKQRTTSITVTSPASPPVTSTPVSGVSIEFEWERDTQSGKGKLDSVNEHTLTGTLETATASIGTLKLQKA